MPRLKSQQPILWTPPPRGIGRMKKWEFHNVMLVVLLVLILILLIGLAIYRYENPRSSHTYNTEKILLSINTANPVGGANLLQVKNKV